MIVYFCSVLVYICRLVALLDLRIKCSKLRMNEMVKCSKNLKRMFFSNCRIYVDAVVLLTIPRFTFNLSVI